MRWWRNRNREQDLERELRSDLDLEAAEQRQSGLSPKRRSTRLCGRSAILPY